MLEEKTNRADAVALLGEAELVLEGKIAYIIELDRTLSVRIRELEEECDRKSEEIESRGEALSASREEDNKNRHVRDKIIVELSEKLEAANQEINRAHETAGRVNAELTESVKQVASLEEELAGLRQTLAAEQSAHGALQDELRAVAAHHDECQTALSTQQADLQKARAEAQVAEDINRRIQDSALWRWSKLWRRWFGPEL